MCCEQAVNAVLPEFTRKLKNTAAMRRLRYDLYTCIYRCVRGTVTRVLAPAVSRQLGARRRCQR